MQDITFKFRQFDLRLATYELRCAGEPVKLERIPMDLLILLVERRGELVTREAIIERLWGKEVFLDTEHSINTAINKLRGVLHDSVRSPMFIQTVVGKGYRFIAPVETMAAAGEIVDVTVPQQPVHMEEPAALEDSSLTPVTGLPRAVLAAEPSTLKNGWRSQWGRLLWGAFTIATILLVFVGREWFSRTGMVSANTYRSVAVCPF
jgi:DNA-binding winged helix-turn-helix (wHTH) protein